MPLSKPSVKVLPASISDKPLIGQMIELYLHDLSEIEDVDLNEQGYFSYPYIDFYWTESDRYPFIVRIEKKLVGFVLVNHHTCFVGSEYAIAEFFILRKYRRRGIGQAVAWQIFDLFQGQWEICQSQAHISAQQFWRQTIEKYTDGNYTETVVNDQGRKRIVQRFDNKVIGLNV